MEETKEKTAKIDSDGIKNLIIDKLFNGDPAGPFEYNDVRELSNELSAKIQKVKEDVWDEAWKAFLKNNPKNPYRS